MCDTQKHPSGAIDFSARRKGKKTIQPEFTFLQCTDGSLKAAKHVHHAQFWHLPEQNQILASRRENDKNGGGQNFLSQAELCDSVCSGTLPFYLCELAAVFHCAGPSPRESISEGNLSKLWWKLSCYLPLLIRLEYMGHTKNAATHKMVRRNPSTDNKTVQWFIFFALHISPGCHLHKPGSSKAICQQTRLGPPNQPFLQPFGLPVWLENKFSTS